ncbi:hypothetical protein FSP39_007864 [Pinctada imbricata]|uniref:Uncharacterized protein n=1 Tax=Pinctada imbricata TaxID=66713 RepID=A0AA88XVV6_PINIB|nr:hypothetical protein FSP39_007864 [Pinctada imbricata]
MCKDMKIKVSLTDVRVARQWRPGDIVLGSSDHGCNIHTVHPEQPGIYAKILTKTEMKNNRVDLIVEQAKPLDIFEEAKISVHVERDAERFHSRHKRSTSSQQSIANFLKIPLESIDWNKTVHTTIPFNSDKKVLALRKMSYQILPEIIVEDRADFVEAVDPEFEFLCSNCLGDTTLGYHM